MKLSVHPARQRWLLIVLFIYSAIPLMASDPIPPTAVCDDQVNVSLTQNGEARVYAATFDEGSNDNSCLASIKVRRMDQPSASFGPYVVFNCADIGQLVQVELLAIDCAGNTNACWSNATVEDKLAPSLSCPPAQSVACHHSTNWDYAGTPEVYDNCGVANLDFTDQDHTNSCGAGQILRTWTATDNFGNSNSCTQSVYLFDNTPVEVHFPPDYTTYECTSVDDLDPDNLPAPFDRPEVLYADCELIATNYEDWVFTAASESCVKVLREWRVIDWCTYEYGGTQGIWSETQILKIQDTLPPVFTCPDDLVVPTSFTSCTASFTLPQPTDISDCLSDVSVKITGDLGEGSQFTDVPIGQYEVKYVLEDGCNNQSACSITVTVEDGTAPTPICLEGVSVALMEGGMNELWASDIEIGSSYDNCTPYELLDFRLGFEPIPGQTSPPADDVLTFTCEEEGMNVIALWVGDKAGNWGYCLTSAVVQDNIGTCGPDTTTVTPAAAIGGRTLDFQGDKIPEVEVQLAAVGAAMTDTSGQYMFDSMPMGGSYTLSAQKIDDPRAGITTADLIRIARHLMGVDTLTSPYQLIAADVDQSGTIDSDDIMMLHFILLGVQPGLADSLGWRFIPEAFIFSADSMMMQGYPQEIQIDTLNEDVMDAHFVGVKLGDVNGSAMQDTAADLLSLQGRSNSAGRLEVPDQQLQPGIAYRLPLYPADGAYWQGGVLRFNHPGIRVTKIEPAAGVLLSLDQSQANVTSFSWLNQRAASAERPVCYVEVEVEQAALLSEHLSIGSGSEHIDADGAAQPVALVFRQRSAEVAVFPNPFREEVTLRYQLAGEEHVRLQVWDAQGRLLLNAAQLALAGINEWKLDSRALPVPGTYFFRLSSGHLQYQGRLIRSGW